jgi:hypothetical protein
MTPEQAAEHATVTAAARGEDLRSRRACWTCRYAADDMLDCRAKPVPFDWIRANCPEDLDFAPTHTARNCPGYEDAP